MKKTNGPGDGIKKARKVNKVPKGYIPVGLKGYENYYHNPQSKRAELQAAVKTSGSKTGMSKDYEDKIKNLLGSGYSLEELVNKGYGTTEGLTPYSKYYKENTDDYVYIDPQTTTPKPEEAFRGEPIDVRNGVSARLVGFLNTAMKRTPDVNKSEGMTNTGLEDGIFMYASPENSPNYGKPDASRGKYKLPNSVISKLMGATSTISDPNFDISEYKIDDKGEYIKKPTATAKLALGGNVEDLVQQIPALLGAISSISSNQRPSKEPLINTSTIRNMTNPYKMALGGEIESLDEDTLAQVQAIADENGVDLEEAYEIFLQQIQEDELNQEQAFEDVEEEEPYESDLADFDSGSDADRYAVGGRVGSKKVEVEGKEVIETPNGNVMEVHGKSHEQGGVDLNLPKGTKVFSDRLQIEGKSMKDRKLKREKTLAKLERLLEKRPNRKLLKNTLARTKEALDNEDAQDMALQNLANKIYAAPTEEKESFPTGGIVGNKRGFSDNDLLVGDQFLLENLNPIAGRGGVNINDIGVGNRFIMENPVTQVPTSAPFHRPDPVLDMGKPSGVQDETTDSEGLTVGDYVGLAGTAFGSIAPLMNTIANRKNRLPNVNRFRGFGREALEDNNTAQSYVDRVASNELTDIDTSANSSYSRNNNSASSVNTVRALNAVSDMNKNKARAAVASNRLKSMAGILSQRGQLNNLKDAREMSGQKQVDTENQQDLDNYYSNMGINLGNLATGIQQAGRNLNINQSNQDESELLGLLSRYGIKIGRDKNGKRIIINT